MTAEPAEPASVKLPEPMAYAARQIAAREGKALGQWVREILGREIARRAGTCSECGQPRPRSG